MEHRAAPEDGEPLTGRREKVRGIRICSLEGSEVPIVDWPEAVSHDWRQRIDQTQTIANAPPTGGDRANGVSRCSEVTAFKRRTADWDML
jgi:hypothetical protein